MKRNRAAADLIGLLCGTALGAAVGLMFAPKAGSELRQTLYESTGDIRQAARFFMPPPTKTTCSGRSHGKSCNNWARAPERDPIHFNYDWIWVSPHFGMLTTSAAGSTS